MMRTFNVTGACDPQLHYMVDIQDKLKEIKALVDSGAYFTINRARQFGKTTTLRALAEYLAADYVVISLDFQMIGNEGFASEHSFSRTFINFLSRTIKNRKAPVDGLDVSILDRMADSVKEDEFFGLADLFTCLSDLCDTACKPVLLMIDEVDSATNNQVFLDFLAQLRAYYLKRRELSTFWSVILAGVHDVKNIKRKLCTDEQHKINSPWNVAKDFLVDMSFSKNGIAGMLKDYESDYNTGMDVDEISELLYDYTSGYPFLVSRLCGLIDERIADSREFPNKKSAWTAGGFLEAVKILLSEKNTLFESLMEKLYGYPELSRMVYSILFDGEKIVYNPFDAVMDMALMFGFAKKKDSSVIIANRIFETVLYDYFLTAGDAQANSIFKAAAQNKTQFIHGGHLDMVLVLRKFVEYFHDIYGYPFEKFDEEEGRRRFLLYLRPIINGVGNYYIEAETRNSRRMDVVVDYRGERLVVELKIWRENAYRERGEQQLSDYLDYFHLQKGYMLSYNFNQKKEVGVKEIKLGGKTLVEAVV